MRARPRHHRQAAPRDEIASPADRRDAAALHVGDGGPGIGLGLLRPQSCVRRIRQVPDHADELALLGRDLPRVDRQADQTPWNQEKVAYGRLRDLYRTLKSWDRVAYWWLTGCNERRRKRWSGTRRRTSRLDHGAPAPRAAGWRPDAAPDPIARRARGLAGRRRPPGPADEAGADAGRGVASSASGLIVRVRSRHGRAHAG